MAAPILINVFPPNAFIVQSADGSAYDLLSANVSTGVVTSAYLPSSATSFLTARLQYLLTLLPSLSSTALKALIRNLVTLEALEGAYTATVTPTGSNYALGLSGLTTPNNLQVSIPFSTSSPFISPGLTTGQVATAVSTPGTDINTAVLTVTDGGFWEVVGDYALLTPSNVVTSLAQWTIAEGTIATTWATIYGQETRSIFDCYSSNACGGFYRRVGGNSAALTIGSWGTGTSAGLSASMAIVGGTGDVRISVTGALNQPCNWRAHVRRWVSH